VPWSWSREKLGAGVSLGHFFYFYNFRNQNIRSEVVVHTQFFMVILFTDERGMSIAVCNFLKFTSVIQLPVTCSLLKRSSQVQYN